MFPDSDQQFMAQMSITMTYGSTTFVAIDTYTNLITTQKNFQTFFRFSSFLSFFGHMISIVL